MAVDLYVTRDSRSPKALRWTVTPSDVVTSLDSSVVTAGRFDFKRQDGTEGTWTASISDQSEDSLILIHPWEAGDLPDVERMRVWPVLTTTLGGSPVPCVAKTLHVTER